MGIIILSNNVNTLGKGCDNMNTIYDKYMLKFKFNKKITLINII